MFALEYSAKLSWISWMLVYKEKQHLMFWYPLVFAQIIKSEVTWDQYKEERDGFTTKKCLGNAFAR